MFCRNCGKEFDGKFCPECGAAAQNDVEFIQPSQEPVQFSGPDIVDKPKTKKKAPKGCLVAVIVVLALAIIGGMLNGDKDKIPPESMSSSSPVQSSESQQVSDSVASSVAQGSQAKETMGEKNALSKAHTYLSIKGFSHSGLVEQLEFDGFTHDEAVYAVDNCGADWNEQATKSAKTYLEIMSFSKQGLIEQLEFDGFTNDQAVYGAEANGY